MRRENLTCRFAKFLAIGILVSFILGGMAVHAGAKDKTNDASEYTYKLIVVESGDTLWSIASDWSKSTGDDISTYINKVKELNNMNNDLIRSGQNLMIYCGQSMKDRPRSSK